MGQATFLDIIKAIRKLSFKQLLRSLEKYQWEVSGFIIMSFISSLFKNFFSEVYLFLICSYFWNWALASPSLIWKTEGRRYKYSLLRIIVGFERKMRVAFLWDRCGGKKIYRPLGRILSVAVLGLFVSLMFKTIFIQYFILGSLQFELFRALKYFEQESV